MKKCKILIEELMKYLSNEFECYTDGPFIVVNTPFQYSDGDHIQLFIQEFEDLLIVSDLGETARRMDAYNFNWKSAQVKEIHHQILVSNDIEEISHVLQFKTKTLENHGYKIFSLLSAIQQKDNLIVLKRKTTKKTFKDQVEVFLLKEGYKPETEFNIDGESGTEYKIDFFINHNTNTMFKALSSVSESGDTDQIARAYMAYSDISKKHDNLHRSVILDDIETVWEKNQIDLIDQVLDKPIIYWSKREELINLFPLNY